MSKHFSDKQIEAIDSIIKAAIDKQKVVIDGLIKAAIDHLRVQCTDAWNALDDRLVELNEHCKELSAKIDKKDELIKALKEELAILNESQLKTPSKEDASWCEILTGKKKKSNEQVDLINVASKENNERLKKENNLIIFGLSELNNAGVAEQKANDEIQVKKIFKEMKLENIKFEKTTRIYSKDKNKPNPLILVLKDKAERNKLLSLAKNLKKSIDFGTVFLCQDLTETQRASLKRLIQERKRLNEENKQQSEYYFGIREDKVIKIIKKKPITAPKPKTAES